MRRTRPTLIPPTYYTGQRISFESNTCTVRYIGAVEGTDKEWLGVEWDDPSRGKHDGSHKGRRYFKCMCLFPFIRDFIVSYLAQVKALLRLRHLSSAQPE
jgi:dynactin complex subunit